MVDPSRFKDGGSYLYLFANEILVVCPRCTHRAVVLADGAISRGSAPKLVCPSCGLVQQPPNRTSEWGKAVDPWFAYDLWLTAPFRGHVVWAFNKRHAQRLRDFVKAELRQRGPTPVCPGGDRIDTMSMTEKLPSWFKAAHNREPLARLLDELISRAA